MGTGTAQVTIAFFENGNSKATSTRMEQVDNVDSTHEATKYAEFYLVRRYVTNEAFEVVTHAKMIEKPVVRSKSIPNIDITEQSLRELRKAYYPGGSGPLTMMGTIVALIDHIAQQNNWDVKDLKQP